MTQDRYWWACGPRGWAIETWRGEPLARNVTVVAYARDLESADALVTELNRLSDPITIAGLEDQ